MEGAGRQLKWEGEVLAPSPFTMRGIPSSRPPIEHEHDDAKKKRKERKSGQVREEEWP